MWGVCNLLNRTILKGDVLEMLDTMPEESIDCVITSPPYWGLRDYGEKGQWGLEEDFPEYLAKLDKMMAKLKRVLKKTGTVWINLGDSYSGSGKGVGTPLELKKESWGFDKLPKQTTHVQTKSRIGIPERFYINCIDNNWIARNHIPWIKANSMPSSVKDRFNNKWESIFFFAKEQKYYFNLDAVREKSQTVTKPFNIRVRENITGHAQAKLGDLSWTASEKELEEYNEKGERKMANVEGQSTQGIHRNRIKGKSDWPEWNNKQENRKWSESTQTIKNHFGNYDPDGNNLNNPIGKNPGDVFNDNKWNNPESEVVKFSRTKGSGGQYDYGGINSPEGRITALKNMQTHGKNPGDVFNINPRPFAEAHFAVFPPELPIKILKCACPPDGIVLDPFFGAGTVGLSAELLGLRWTGIELKQEYIDIAKKRLAPYKNETIKNFF